MTEPHPTPLERVRLLEQDALHAVSALVGGASLCRTEAPAVKLAEGRAAALAQLRRALRSAGPAVDVVDGVLAGWPEPSPERGPAWFAYLDGGRAVLTELRTELLAERLDPSHDLEAEDLA